MNNQNQNQNSNTRRFGRGDRKPFRERKEKEFEERVLEIARVTRVVKGGKRFKFRAAVVIGDRKGRVGFGLGKGSDVAQSVQKAVHHAKKSMINVPIINGTISHEVKVKFGSSVIFLKPAPAGRGINAGGAVRAVSELAGIKDIIGKIISRSGSKINNARATLKAFGIIAAKNVK